MNHLQFAIFHLKRALRTAFAIFGILAILLTASCGPSNSGSKAKKTPLVEEESEPAETPHINSHDDSEPAFELKPREISPAKTEEQKPKVETEQPTEVIPKGDTATLDPEVKSKAPMPLNAPESSATGTVSDDDIRATVTRLNSNYLWAMAPTFTDVYKDQNGEKHEFLKVTPGESKELRDLLIKMREDLANRHVTVDLKEQGACAHEDKEISGSKKSICLSLEKIKIENTSETLELSVRKAIMAQLARQYGADDELVALVQAYYELSAVRKLNTVNSVVSAFTRVRSKLLYLQAALTTGVRPLSDGDAPKMDSKEEICMLITGGIRFATLLQDQVIQSGFIQDPTEGKASRVLLAETFQAMSPFCDGTSDNRQELLQLVNTAIQYYDQLAQEFSENSGVIIFDFSKHQWTNGT